MLTLHQRLNEFQNHVLHVTALMLPFSGSFGIQLKTHLSDKFPDLVTALLILLSPRGSAARVGGQGRLSAGLSVQWAPQLSPGISLAVRSRAMRAMPPRVPCRQTAHRGHESPGFGVGFPHFLVGFANFSFSGTDFYPP